MTALFSRSMFVLYIATGILFLGWVTMSSPAAAAASPAKAAPPKSVAAEEPESSEGSGTAERPRPIFDQNPDDHYNQGDRVDPFTLGRLQEIPPVVPRPDENPTAVAPVPVDHWSSRLAESRKIYVEADRLLSAETKERFSKVESECQRQVSSLKADISELRKKGTVDAANHLNAFQAMAERFQRLEATARRLRLKDEVEADFAGRKIAVEGIVWKSGNPVAAVNGQAVVEGQVLHIGGSKGKGLDAIQVYRIERDSVIFIFRGMQVSAYLQQRGGL
jgi:hypothetical protein